MAKYLNRNLTKEDKQMANKQVKRCSYIIRELKIKTRRYHCTKALNTTPNAGLDVEQQEVVLLLVGTQNCTATCKDR